ncbi:MAG: hypothetical protein IJJ33_14275 [Victivallales bacterium]|nr:hypothetical protein [Victivallales bacterium]
MMCQGENLSSQESLILAELNKKAPPAGCEAEYQKLKQQNQELYSRLYAGSQRTDASGGQLNQLESQIAYLQQRIARQRQTRDRLMAGVSNTQAGVVQFTMSLNDFLSERLSTKSYFPLGVPVFRRQQVLKPQSPSGKTLVVDMGNASATPLLALGGELVCTGQGKAQFVVLRPIEGELMAVIKAGGEIEIGAQDKKKDNGGYYQRTILFEDDLVTMEKGDFFGVIVDNALGLTYDAHGTGSAAIVPLQEAELPDELSMKKPQDIRQPAPSGKNESWRQFSRERDEGMAFSFNLLVSIVE